MGVGGDSAGGTISASVAHDVPGLAFQVSIISKLTSSAWCGVVWCSVVLSGVGVCGVVLCGIVWCGIVWCGVV